jgi:hypothetical protein
VNDVLITTVARTLLAKYRIPESPNLHVRCVCHVVNLVVQDILAALGEADSPDDIDYYSFHKEQPFHLDIDADPDQIELDHEEFEDDVEDKNTDSDNITLEDEEKSEATNSPLSKVMFSYQDVSLHLYSHASFVLSRKKLSRRLNDARGFVSVRSHNISRKTRIRSIKTGDNRWPLSGMSAHAGIIRTQ